MPVNFELLRKRQANYRNIAIAEQQQQLMDKLEAEAHEINDLIDWLKPLGISPDETGYDGMKPFVISDGFSFKLFNQHFQGYQVVLSIWRISSQRSEDVGVWHSSPMTWSAKTVEKKQYEIMTAIDMLLSEPEVSDDDPLTDERVDCVPVADLPDNDDPHACPLCGEEYNIEMTDDGWQCGECEHIWTDFDDNTDNPCELVPPQESFIPSPQTIAANRADMFNRNIPPAPYDTDFPED